VLDLFVVLFVIIMRLTAELILRSGSYLNPLREREINLRGNKVAVIENLGATQDQYDCIDLSDNEIAKLDGFPLLHRLRTLLLNNNKISKIGSLGESLPALTTLILTNNKLANLNEIDPLAELNSLTHLSLLDNNVSKKQHYRLYIIHKLPKLKILDFRKISQKERVASEKLFGKSVPQDLSQKNKTLEQQKSNTFSTSTPLPLPQSTLNTDQQNAIKAAIANAKSLEEAAALENALASGQFPAFLQSSVPTTATNGTNQQQSNPDAMES